MVRESPIDTKFIYPIVLFAVMSAWFVDANLDNPVAPLTPQVYDNESMMGPIFSNPLSLGVKRVNWVPGGKCNIEYINGTPMDGKVHAINKDTPLHLTGWAMDDEYARLPKSVVVRFTSAKHGHFFSPARIELSRGDVKDYFKLPIRLLNSGFDLFTSVREMPRDEYRLMLIILLEDVTYICNNGRKIQIHE